MEIIEKAELKAYRKPVVRVIDIKSEGIIAMSNEDIEEREDDL